MYCQQCGAAAGQDASFCVQCGVKLASSEFPILNEPVQEPESVFRPPKKPSADLPAAQSIAPPKTTPKKYTLLLWFFGGLTALAAVGMFVVAFMGLGPDGKAGGSLAFWSGVCFALYWARNEKSAGIGLIVGVVVAVAAVAIAAAIAGFARAI